MRYVVMSVVVAIFLSGSTILAEDAWWQWGGPQRNGVSPDKRLCASWYGAPFLLWKIEDLGVGYSSPVVSNGIVCTMAKRGSRTFVVAIDDESGKELWAVDIDNAKDGGWPGPRSTPAIDGDRIYALSENGKLVCLRFKSGERIWGIDYRADYHSRLSKKSHGFSESLLVDGDRLICTPDGPDACVVALDKKTGREIWRCAAAFQDDKEKHRRRVSYTSTVVSYAAGIKQYVQVMSEGLIGVEAESGKQLWTYCGFGKGNGSGGGDEFICTPITRGDYVFCGYHHNKKGSVLLKIRKSKNGLSINEMYTNNDSLEIYMGGCILAGDHLYISDYGKMHCLEFLTGKIMWTESAESKGLLAYADGNIYCRSKSGNVLLIGASPKDYHLKGSFAMPADRLLHCKGEREIYNQPAISNGRLYLREANLLHCYDLRILTR